MELVGRRLPKGHGMSALDYTKWPKSCPIYTEKLSWLQAYPTQKAKKLGINAPMLHPHPRFLINFPSGAHFVFWGYNPNSTNISLNNYTNLKKSDNYDRKFQIKSIVNT